MEQFDDINEMNKFINEMNKFESRFGAIRGEEKMLAVKKLMLESLLFYRFRGTTIAYSEIIIALENIIVDKVPTVPSSKNRRNDTSAPMEIGMACEPRRRPKDHRPRSVGCLQRNWQRKWGFGKGQNWSEKGGKGGKDGGKNSWQKGSGKKEERVKRRVATEIPERVGRAVRQGTLQLGAEKEETQIKTPLMKMTVRTSKNRPKMRRVCKRGACWKKARMSSGKK